MRLLGIDYGEKRIGVALSDEVPDFAYPHSVIQNSPHAIKKIQELCIKEGVGAIVLGKSLDYAGTPNPIMKKIEVFKIKLEEASGLPVYWEAEMLTSAEAARVQGKTPTLDASAAALILKSYITKNSPLV